MTSPTLRDVAALAGVSTQTISRVVNGSGQVAESTEQRVREAIQELGFRPNPAARSPRVGYADAVGLVIESIGDPFMATLTAGVEQRLREAGKSLIITSNGYAPENERAAVESLAFRRVAGRIIPPTPTSHAYLADVLAGVPVVFVDRPPVQFDTDSVLADNEGGATLATEHLIAGGHERIAFVGDRIGLFTTSFRYQGLSSRPTRGPHSASCVRCTRMVPAWSRTWASMTSMPPKRYHPASPSSTTIRQRWDTPQRTCCCSASPTLRARPITSCYRPT